MDIDSSHMLSHRLGFGQIEDLGLITAVTLQFIALGHGTHNAAHNIGNRGGLFHFAESRGLP